MCSDRPASEDAIAEDGRRQRSERNRQKIISAMFELVREGNFDPSVAQVVERAGVGLRTVFRHFDEVDSLYQEMTAQMDARIIPEIQKPLNATEWPDRVKELMARRIRIFEDIMPVKICAGVRRFRSEYLMERHKRFVSHETAALALALPQEILSNESLMASFDIVFSFDTWRRLRQDQRYSRAKATEVMETMLDALIAAA